MTALVVRAGDRELDGAVRDGESWWAAARRIGGSLSSAPVADDLSGEPKRFVVDPRVRVDLRAMTHDDLRLAVRWRSDPGVLRWWAPGELASPEQIAAKYGERIDGRSPTRMWVVEADGHPVGFVQDYRIGDYPDYARLGPDAEAIGVDYAIGDPSWRGRGLGVPMLWAWALRARQRFPDAATFFAAPDEHNTGSCRTLAKAGFTPGEPFEQPRDDGTSETVVGHTLDVATVLGRDD